MDLTLLLALFKEFDTLGLFIVLVVLAVKLGNLDRRLSRIEKLIDEKFCHLLNAITKDKLLSARNRNKGDRN